MGWTAADVAVRRAGGGGREAPTVAGWAGVAERGNGRGNPQGVARNRRSHLRSRTSQIQHPRRRRHNSRHLSGSSCWCRRSAQRVERGALRVARAVQEAMLGGGAAADKSVDGVGGDHHNRGNRSRRGTLHTPSPDRRRHSRCRKRACTCLCRRSVLRAGGAARVAAWAAREGAQAARAAVATWDPEGWQVGADHRMGAARGQVPRR